MGNPDFSGFRSQVSNGSDDRVVMG